MNMEIGPASLSDKSEDMGFRNKIDDLLGQGAGVVVAVCNCKPVVAFAVEDEIRVDAVLAVKNSCLPELT